MIPTFIRVNSDLLQPLRGLILLASSICYMGVHKATHMIFFVLLRLSSAALDY